MSALFCAGGWTSLLAYTERLSSVGENGAGRSCAAAPAGQCIGCLSEIPAYYSSLLPIRRRALALCCTWLAWRRASLLAFTNAPVSRKRPRTACLHAHDIGCAPRPCRVLRELARSSKVLRACAGLDEPDAGSVVRRRNTRVGFLAQAGARF